eukprot:TRINITY_DN383_c0_g1_i1.p1 TRINITY_DN383_c0_g1~~TRINITY_DN383_c0_g1_i1.p1  ORF type:complete len:3487 (+),score=923.94 TRINITY_DN383_c0_g1_i1:225-10685(+)
MRTLSILLLFGSICLIGLLAQNNAVNDLYCNDLPHLPMTFDSMSYLEFDEEFHMHGEYRLNLAQSYQTIDFTLRQQSSVRFYTEPHEIDCDLWLFNQSDPSDPITHSSLFVGTEEVIAKTLPAGSYRLKLNYFGFWLGTYDATDCDTMTVEFAIAPTSRVLDRVNSFNCPGSEKFPGFTVDASTVADGKTIWYSSQVNETGVLNAQQTPTPNQPNMIKYLKSYEINLPEMKDASTWWILDATLGFNFFTGDSVGFMIDSTNTSATKPDMITCFQKNMCQVGTNVVLNEAKLHAILTPGKYYLWIFEKTGEKDPSLNVCSPFTFDFWLHLEESQEDILTCEALPLPDKLMPGMFDEPPGYLYYHDWPLMELEKGSRVIPFTISQPSFFRMYTSPHRVDVDLKLTDSATGNDIEYAFSFEGDEVLAAYLQPGNYSVTVIYFGTYEMQFCEAFEVQIAISPATYLQNNCGGQASNPDLSGIANIGNTQNAFSLPLNTFQYNYGGDYKQKTIYSSPHFTITVPTIFRAELGDQFASADVQMVLYNYVNDDANSVGVFTPKRVRNMDIISTTLAAGTYSLEILTGAMDTNPKVGLSNFPTCARYTLQVDLSPVPSGHQCKEYDRIPSNLNTVPFLGGSNIVHFAGEYLVPFTPNQWTTAETIKFKPKVSSFFRVWSEPNVVDIDFYLYEEGTQAAVVSTIKVNEEESVFWQLKPNTNYSLQIVYYKWGSTAGNNCYRYDIELAISPIIGSPNSQCTVNLPEESSLIPDSSPTQNSFYLHESYTYKQRNSPLRLRLPFSLDDFFYFRAIIAYDFVMTDISLVLTVSDQPSQKRYGANEYNSYDLETLVLGPGSYVLEIYEVTPMSSSLQGCADFTLTIGYQLQDQPGQTSELQGCSDLEIPDNLNRLHLLSPLTGNSVHMARYFLVDVEDRMNTMSFTLSEPSVFTMHVPPFKGLDIDLLLYSGPVGQGTNPLENENGFTEEAIYRILPAGQYYLQVRYYGFGNSPLPPASACVAFPASFAITPVASLEAEQKLITPCAATTPPSGPLTFNNWTVKSFNRTLGSDFSTPIQFEVDTDAALLRFTVNYNFPSRGLTFVVTGQADQGALTPVPVSYSANVAMNHAYLDKVLMRGTYNITIRDPYPLGANHVDNNLKCSPYQISYYISETEPDDDVCTTVDLPTDTFTMEGGSYPFGGPQENDGTIRLWGEGFALSADNRDNLIQFKVPVDSYVRFYVHSEAMAQHDLDFFVYSNVNRTSSSLVMHSIGNDEDESAVTFMKAQGAPAVINIHVFHLDPAFPCPSFYFEMAMRPASVVRQELLCPITLPAQEVPPAIIDFSQDIYSDDYIFTKSRILGNVNRGKFRYRMTLRASTNTTFAAEIGFDFLANDFSLELRETGSDTQLLSQGESYASDDRDDYFNFINRLEAEIAPGDYYLDIVEDLSGKSNFSLPDYCHKFTFELTSFTLGGDPTITLVTPPGGTQLNPYMPVIVDINFSEKVRATSLDQTAWVISQSAVYLYAQGNPQARIAPKEARFDSSYRKLTVRFDAQDLSLGDSYVLSISASKFVSDANATPFKFDPSRPYVFIYTMADCSCNGHGYCIPNSVQCICQPGYAGDACDECDEGYHPAADLCYPDDHCQASDCNGHGTCDDSEGYVQCFCDEGYATVSNNWCTICAPGYTGYPNCQPKGDQTDRPDTCKAPLLPTNLNTVNYLGFSGSTHLQGDYYVDIDNLQHEIAFSLSQNSVFRAYAEPHAVDIDLWLYLINPDGTRKSIDSGVAIYTEEVIFQELTGNSTTPTNYVLKVRYFPWNDDVPTECITFNFEMAIEPIDRVKSEAQATASSCKAASVLPANNNATFSLIPAAGYSFSLPTQIYSYNARTGSVSGPGYFYRYNFQVVPPQGMVGVLRAEVGYRFLQGQVALLLESNVGSGRDHCGVSGGADSRCLSGEMAWNRNKIKADLTAGNYSLWIYEPEPQKTDLAACALFNFYFNLEFMEARNELYECDALTLPKSLNYPGYLDNSGYVHVREHFLIDSDPMSLVLNQASNIRIHGHGDQTRIAFSFKDVNNGNREILSSMFGTETGFIANVQPGSYTIEILSIASAEGTNNCDVATIEMVVQPSNINYGNGNCPTSDSFPQLTNIHVPFSFGNTSIGQQAPDQFYAISTTQVFREYQFTLDQTASLKAWIDSDFMTAALRVAVYSAQTSQTIYGQYRYNRNQLDEVLAPGSYTLRILPAGDYPVSGNPTTRFPPCKEFNFGVILAAADDVLNNPCNYQGEPLPITLNTIRFLSLDNETDYQHTNFRVPPFGGNQFVLRHITVSVPVRSSIRIYTEPHEVDIDLALRQAGSATNLASGGFNFNDEESFVYVLEPSVNYVIDLTFWRWDDISDCPTFNMEIAVAPLNGLPKVCGGQGADHWPPLPIGDHFKVPFYYDSVDIDESIFYQQRANEIRDFTWEFSLSQAADFYARIGYDFLTGDLMMRLDSSDGETSYYGANDPHGNKLDLLGLEAGDYTLHIYEVVVNSATIGCSNFTFEIDVNAASTSRDIFYPDLPRTLNSVAYLSATGSVHIADTYELFARNGTARNESVTFMITQQSYLKVVTSHGSTGDAPLMLILTGDRTAQTFVGGFLAKIAAGAYTLTFLHDNTTREGDNVGRVIAQIELAIRPVSTTTNEISSYTPATQTCTTKALDTVTLNDDGFYQFSDEQMTIQTPTSKGHQVVAQTSFAITKPSILYVSVGFQFLLGDLYVNLTGMTGQAPINMVGQRSRNYDEMFAYLPIGTYSLRIIQNVPIDTTTLKCLVYDVAIVIQDAAGATHTDCSDYNVVPWDLISPTGGSQYFGGPISSGGVLHMYGEFLMPIEGTETDTMSLAITKSSVLSIITEENYFGEISPTVQTGGAMQLIIPNSGKFSSSQQKQRAEIFYLKHRGSGNNPEPFEIELHYQPPSRIACPYFSIQVLLQPESLVKQSMECDGTTTNQKLPTKQVSTSAGNFRESITSFFSSQSDITRGTAFKYEIAVNVTQASRIVASLGFNALTNIFNVQIMKLSTLTGTKYQVGYGSYKMDNTESGYLNAQIDFAGSVMPGMYYIWIQQPSITLNITTSPMCYPFSWSLDVSSDTGSPYISHVVPAGGATLLPSEPLVVRVTFSQPVYSNGQLISASNLSPLLLAFALESTDSTKPQNPIFPVRAEVPFDSAVNTFILTFNPQDFRNSTTYELSLTPGILKNQNGEDVQLISTHQFSMANSACNGHGEVENGQCLCCIGYTGPNCDVCATGYEKVGMTCLLKTGNMCYENTCGCDPKQPPDCSTACTPIGTCTDGTCHCPPNYDGDHCEKCKDGYEDWANGCVKSKTCPECVRGTCNTETGACECPEHWAGTKCDECARGWGGDNCDKEVVSDDGGTNANIDSAMHKMNYVAIVLGVLALVGTVGYLVYRKYRKPKSYASVFQSAEMNDFGDNDDFLDKDDFLEEEDRDVESSKVGLDEEEEEKPKKEEKNLVQLD